MVVVVLQLKVTFLVVPFTFRRESCKMDQPFVKTYATLGYLWWRDGSLSHSAPRTILSLSFRGEREKKKEKEENLTIKWSCCNPPQKKKMLRKCLVSMPSNVLFPPSFREIRKQKKKSIVSSCSRKHWRPLTSGSLTSGVKSSTIKIWAQ